MKGIRIVLIVLGILVILFIAVYLVYNLPLGRHLGFIPPTQPAQSDPTAIIVPTLSATPDSTFSQASLSTQAAGNCGETGVIKVLLLGENLPETPSRGADAIRLMRIDFDHMRLDILALPPDLWVQTPDLASVEIDAAALTFVYYQGKKITGGDERVKMMGATRYVAQTLAGNFGYLPTNYITLKQGVFRDLVDQLGGLRITIPQAVDATPEGLGIFPAGEQILSGQQAVDYVRILAPANDPAPDEWSRITRQNQILVALNAQLTSPQSLTKVPDIIQQFYSNIITDLSLKQLFSLTCMLGASGVTINLSELNPQHISPGAGGAILPQTPEVAKFILEKVGP